MKLRGWLGPDLPRLATVAAAHAGIGLAPKTHPVVASNNDSVALYLSGTTTLHVLHTTQGDAIAHTAGCGGLVQLLLECAR